MEEDQERVKKLLERYRLGQCTPEESRRVHAWLNHYAKHEADGIDQLISKYHTAAPSRVKTLSWLPWAAAIVLLAAGLAWYAPGINKYWLRSTTAELAQLEDIPPGGNRATLTLANGEQILLSESQTGIIIGDNNISYQDGSTILDDRQQTKDNRQANGKGSLASNVSNLMSISTPKGGTYAVTLPDGSRVWLNAASKLTYPSHFTGNERLVSIEGEAYFSVAKNTKIPFKVRSNGQEIEVVGTEFNVEAYGNKGNVRTTLVEGSVRISRNGQTPSSRLLRPGQQSILKGEHFEIRPVDVSLATAWKNGAFHFDNTPLHEVLEQIARWYDIDVVYERTIPKELFSGSMSRNVSLQTVLELLRVSEVPYQLQGNQLHIK